jgi:hypothetical protein
LIYHFFPHLHIIVTIENFIEMLFPSFHCKQMISYKLLYLSLQMDILGQEPAFIPQLLYRTSCLVLLFTSSLLPGIFKCMSYSLPCTDFLGFPSLIFLILNIRSCLPIPHFN